MQSSFAQMKKVKEIFLGRSIVFVLLSAPPLPDEAMIEEGIYIPDGHPLSSPTRRYIEIDRQLFSDEYGPLLNYVLYIRQDEKQQNNTPQSYRDGTYLDAMRNSSIDYLAFNLSLDESMLALGMNLSFVLGNNTSCSNESYSTPICNGPLKPSTIYK